METNIRTALSHIQEAKDLLVRFWDDYEDVQRATHDLENVRQELEGMLHKCLEGTLK